MGFPRSPRAAMEAAPALGAAAALAVFAAATLLMPASLLFEAKPAPPAKPVKCWPVEIGAQEPPVKTAAADPPPTYPEAATDLVLSVNGKEQRIRNPSPSMLLVDYLRHELGLTGTKIGCGEGGCGACTVMLSTYDAASKTVRHAAVNAW